MTRPRNGCGGTPGLARDLEQRQLRLARVPGIQRLLACPRQVGRAEVHPAVGDVHAGHVHAVTGRAGALGRDCRDRRCSDACASLIQKVRNMKTSCPRAIDSRMRLRAGRTRSAARQRASTHRPPESPSCVVLLPSTPAGPIATLRTPSPGGPSASIEVAGRRVPHLRGVQLRVRNQTICCSCARRQPAGELQVRLRGLDAPAP